MSSAKSKKWKTLVGTQGKFEERDIYHWFRGDCRNEIQVAAAVEKHSGNTLTGLSSLIPLLATRSCDCACACVPWMDVGVAVGGDVCMQGARIMRCAC